MLDDNNIERTLIKGTSFKSIIQCSKIWYFNGKKNECEKYNFIMNILI
jgi:hypothetical protein